MNNNGTIGFNVYLWYLCVIFSLNVWAEHTLFHTKKKRKIRIRCREYNTQSTDKTTLMIVMIGKNTYESMRNMRIIGLLSTLIHSLFPFLLFLFLNILYLPLQQRFPTKRMIKKSIGLAPCRIYWMMPIDTLILWSSIAHEFWETWYALHTRRFT